MLAKKVLIIGPFSPPITGVSFANDTLIKGLKGYNLTVDFIDYSYPTLSEDIGKLSLKKILYYFKLYFYAYKIPKSNTIYMTPGQTFFGVLKYYPFILISKIFKKETIIHVHGDYLWKEFKNLKGVKQNIFRFVLSKFNKGIVLSPKLRRNLKPFLKDDNIYEVYNFVENNIFNKVTLTDIQNKNIKELNIVYLSNLIKEKGIFDLLESLLLLKNKNISFNASIAGAIGSSSKKELDIFFRKLKKDVKYLGVVRNDAKLKLLLNSNIFVFPTFYKMEGQPISILEAMATGNIIMTTDHAGISDIFNENKNGVFIEKNNPKDIAKKLETISLDIQKYTHITINNHLESKKKYTTQNFVSNILEIIKK